jgi:hypothetical protein
MTKIEGSGSGSGSIGQSHGSADPDPDPPQNIMDPQHCFKGFSEDGGGQNLLKISALFHFNKIYQMRHF